MENKGLLEKSFVKWGLYAGLASVVLTFLLYIVDVKLLVSGWISLLIYGMIITFMVLSARQQRSEEGGYLGYGNAVMNSLGVNVISTLISVLFSALLYNVIDPELPETLKTISMENMAATMENFGSSEADIDNALKMAEERQMDYDFKGLSLVALIAIAMNFVIGLIVSIFTRKNPPMFEANESEA